MKLRFLKFLFMEDTRSINKSIFERPNDFAYDIGLYQEILKLPANEDSIGYLLPFLCPLFYCPGVAGINMLET
jgi:hypothetical protein